MNPSVTLYDLLTDPRLLGGTFGGPSFRAHRVIAKLVDGLPLSNEERELARQLTGRRLDRVMAELIAVLVVIAGRRTAKTSCLIACSGIRAACFGRYNLAPGEIGVCLLFGVDRRQATIIRNYILGLLKSSAVLAAMIAAERADEIELTNGHVIRVATSDYRLARGSTAIFAAIDEVAFLQSADGSLNPDVEILNAIRPSLATTGGMLVLSSSPYSRRGVLWDAFRKSYGRDGDPRLVIKASTPVMNPTIDRRVIAEAMAEDRPRALAEWMAEFRSDVDALLTESAVDAVTVGSRLELPRIAGVQYAGFCDPSGGSADSFTLAVSHLDRGGVVVLDAVRERRPPFSPDAVTEEFASVLKSYGLTRVVGDRYAGEWPRERFRVHGITYEPSEKSKSEIYGELLPVVNGRRCELLDLPLLRSQLLGLERRTGRGTGRDSIDHGPGGKDDVSNAAAGAIVLAAGKATSNAKPVSIGESASSWIIGPQDYESGWRSGWPS